MSPSHLHNRLCALCNKLTVAGEARKIVDIGKACQRSKLSGAQCARPAYIDIKAGIRCGCLDIERFARRFERFGNRPGGSDCAGKAGRQNGALVDCYDVMSARRSESDLQDVVNSASRVKDRASPPDAMRID
jgi:hypothetical protein